MEPEESLDPHSYQMLQKLRTAFDERPIMTRRVVYNMFPNEVEAQIKELFRYIVYVFPAGPWRDALVRFGVDPRTDPKYRIYQTMTFKIPTVRQPVGRGNVAAQRSDEVGETQGQGEWMDNRVRWKRGVKNQERDTQSHFFDGKKVVCDGRTWQVCDITDPFIRHVLDVDNLREKCDVSDHQA